MLFAIGIVEKTQDTQEDHLVVCNPTRIPGDCIDE